MNPILFKLVKSTEQNAQMLTNMKKGGQTPRQASLPRLQYPSGDYPDTGAAR